MSQIIYILFLFMIFMFKDESFDWMEGNVWEELEMMKKLITYMHATRFYHWSCIWILFIIKNWKKNVN